MPVPHTKEKIVQCGGNLTKILSWGVFVTEENVVSQSYVGEVGRPDRRRDSWR